MWRLGYINELQLLMNTSFVKHCSWDGEFSVHEWTGDTVLLKDKSCAPALFQCETREDQQEHVKSRVNKFHSRSGLQVKLLNQFFGLRPPGLQFAHNELINHLDGCLQCSPSGPDVVCLSVGLIEDSHTVFMIQPHPQQVTHQHTRMPPLLVENKNHRDKWHHKLINRAREEGDDLVVRYNRRAEVIRNSSAMSAVAVVTNSDGSPLNRGKAISIPTELSGLYFVGLLEDWISGSLTQRVYAMKPCVVQELMAKNEAGGVPLLDLESFLQE